MVLDDAAEADRVFKDAELIHDEATVSRAVKNLGQEITRDMANANPLVICIMNGGLMLTAWLTPLLKFPLQLDYAHATRYRGKTKGGELEWVARPHASLENRSVLLVDDIFDEGYTLAGIAETCRNLGARAVKAAVLVRKLHDRAVPGYEPEFVGLTVPDRYVFGCGMDYKNYLRNLPAIYALRN